MGGNDGFTNFDTSSIITTGSEKTISFGKHSFRRRDLFLGIIAILALLAVIILIIALAVEVSKNEDNKDSDCASVAAAAILHPDSPICTSHACLKSAYLTVQNMQPSASPCEDFYTYACGGFPEANRRTPYLDRVTQATKIEYANLDRLMFSLHEEVNDDDPMYVKKVKNYLTACNNHYDKMELRGTPFVRQIIRQMPGLYLFDEFDVSTFDLQAVMKQVHIDFWTEAFFSMSAGTNLADWTKSIVEFSAGGFSLYPEDYLEGYEQVQTVYKEYMKSLAYLILIDGNVQLDQDALQRIQLFANDTFEVEKELASAAFVLPLSGYIFGNHREENTVTLQKVTQDLDGTIDFVDYMQSMYNEQTPVLDGDFKVAIVHEEYFTHLGVVLKSYLASDEGKRKLHNYMMWQLLSRYADALSWDYIHAKRRVINYLYDYKDDSDGSYDCLVDTNNKMAHALSAIFINHYMEKDSKQEATVLLTEMKEQLLTRIDGFDWMTAEERDLAKNKIKGTIYKVAYPDDLRSDAALNARYTRVTISADNHFKNVLEMNKLSKKLINDVIAHPDHPHEWRYHVFEPAINYYNPWHSMTVTYGAMQSPLYLHSGPKFYNYGGLASHIAEHLMHAVDDIGALYSLDRKNVGLWWSNETYNNYQTVKECTVNSSAHITMGPYALPDGTMYSFSNENQRKNILTSQASFITAGATGLRLAHEVFMRKHANDALPPITADQTPSKLFFLAYAQFHCQNIESAAQRVSLVSGNFPMPGKERVNINVAQVPEFRTAFGCSAQTQLGQGKTCPVFKTP